MNFTAHARLFDQPDPRRLDLRASITGVHREWLVRTYQQPTAITIHVVLDISASMHFGNPGKLQVVADFLHSLGLSAQAYGDAISLLPFDSRFRDDLYIPARRGRALGRIMANHLLHACKAIRGSDQASTANAVDAAISQLEGATGIVFLISDYHWRLDYLPALLDKLSTTTLVPLVVWDPTEVIPPESGQWLLSRDLESNTKHALWLNESRRKQWLDNVQQRREDLIDLFATCNSKPLFIEGTYDAEQLSRYFVEHMI